MILSIGTYSEVLNDKTHGALGISRKWRAINADAFGPFPADATKFCICISEQPRGYAVDKAAAEHCDPHDDEEQDFEAVASCLTQLRGGV